jgi:DNA mismatch repair protein MutS2
VQTAREAELKRREKDAEREGRKQARAYLLEARERVEEALGVARGAAEEAAAKEARRLVEEGVKEAGEALERTEQADGRTGGQGDAFGPGDMVKVSAGSTGQILEVRSDGKLVVAVGAVRMVVEPEAVSRASPSARPPVRPTSPSGPSSPSSLEIDLRGMTGDEAETATVAAVDAAVLAEQPFLRIIHGMGTGVVRDRVQRVVSKDRRVSRYAFAPRNQGGTGVTIVEFSA